MKTTNNQNSSSTEVRTYVKQEGRWYPVMDRNTIDMRGPGYASKKAVQDNLRERSEITDERVTARFI